MAARKTKRGRSTKTKVKRLTRGARKGAAKVGRSVSRGASAAKTKAAAAFGSIKGRFAKKDEEE